MHENEFDPIAHQLTLAADGKACHDTVGQDRCLPSHNNAKRLPPVGPVQPVHQELY